MAPLLKGRGDAPVSLLRCKGKHNFFSMQVSGAISRNFLIRVVRYSWISAIFQKVAGDLRRRSGFWWRFRTFSCQIIGALEIILNFVGDFFIHLNIVVMKSMLRNLLLPAVLMLPVAGAQAASPQTIAFNAEIPSSQVLSLTAQEVKEMIAMGSEWIESVECNNAGVERNLAGTVLKTPKAGEGVTQGSITLNFVGTSYMNATRIQVIGATNSFEQNVVLKVNGNDVGFPSNFTVPASNPWSLSLTELNQKLSANPIGLPFKASNTISPAEPMKKLTLELPATNEGANAFQLVGFRVYFSGETPGDINTGIEEVSEEASAETEYYDMQGRRLAGAPSQGLYIRRCQTRVEKILAH